MRYSLGLYPDTPARDVIATARHAEACGFHRVWLADSHLLWREPHVLLGAIAASTRRLQLATCVTNPVTRHLSVTAAAFVTLAELSGGRVMLGISTGDSAVRTLGLRPATVDALRESTAELRTLLRGPEPIACEPRLHYGGADRIPIAVAASGPRMLALAGEVADCVVLMNGVAPDLVGAAMACVDAGARAAGRDPQAIHRVIWAACHVDASDPGRSLDRCRYNVARAVLRDLPGNEDPLTHAVAARVRARYDYAQHGDPGATFATEIPDALVPRFTFAGDPASVAARIDDLGAIGVDEVALAVPRDPDAAGRDRQLTSLAGSVLDATRPPRHGERP